MRRSLEEHYAILGSYKTELQRVDREGRFEVQTDASGPNNKPIVKRFYVSFSCLRKGYMQGYMPCICLDDYFLKTLVFGALLGVLGRDRKNQIFPISWCVVEGKNE